jgi:predicted flap endonuclease-1-like 5' DNA nuclease
MTWIMVILVSLVVGFLGGWLLEYYLDLKYWEMRARRWTLSSTEINIDTASTDVPTALKEPVIVADTTAGTFPKAAEDATVKIAPPVGTSPEPEAEAEANEQLAATLRRFGEQHKAEVSALRQALKVQKARYEDLERQFEQYLATHPDDLTAIRGIGSVYQWKLRDAGITSYARLANTTPERLREILDIPNWRKIEPESWIEQAQVLGQRGK